MAYISDKQKLTMRMVDQIIGEFGDRWFTRCELPGITKHSFDALVFKRYLAKKVVYDVTYYRRLKKLGDES